ncbi:chitin binding domain-containing protein [Nocardia sp. NBC_01499]|uniref:chitin binding peritrophin-A domain-containing protein n=1 Tax=Nocardia sp. NBC_01499 TaxID=2903597 RepID=UPI00386FB3BC
MTNQEQWEAALTDAQRATLAEWRARDFSQSANDDYPDPDDATRFITLVWGRPVMTPCPLQTNGKRQVFNPTLKVCDFSENVSIDDNPAFRE